MKFLLDKWKPGNWFGKAIKVIANIFCVIATTVLLVIPFLKLEGRWLEAFKLIWIGCAILNLDLFVWYKKAFEKKLIHLVFSLCSTLTLFYLCNYWCLISLAEAVIYSLVAGLLEMAILTRIHKTIRFTEKQRYGLIGQNLIHGITSGCFYMSSLSLFVLAHFLNKSMIFIFGILAIIMLFTSVLLVISNGFKTSKSPFGAVAIIVDIISALALIGYLIYLAPNGEENNNLQEIVLSISSAVIGGAITLAGVAWTIKHQVDSTKEEEKKKYRPLLVARETKIDYSKNLVNKVETQLMFSSLRYEKHDIIVVFTLKNPTEHPICINKILFEDIEYCLHQNAHFYLDSKSEFQINIFTVLEESKKIDASTEMVINVDDMLGNTYHNRLLIKDSLIVSTILEEVTA